jgi:hypothetical protein
VAKPQFHGAHVTAASTFYTLTATIVPLAKRLRFKHDVDSEALNLT